MWHCAFISSFEKRFLFIYTNSNFSCYENTHIGVSTWHSSEMTTTITYRHVRMNYHNEWSRDKNFFTLMKNILGILSSSLKLWPMTIMKMTSACTSSHSYRYYVKWPANLYCFQFFLLSIIYDTLTSGHV